MESYWKILAISALCILVVAGSVAHMAWVTHHALGMVLSLGLAMVGGIYACGSHMSYVREQDFLWFAHFVNKINEQKLGSVSCLDERSEEE